MIAKLYVGNLAWEATEAELYALFRKHGSVSSLVIHRDRETGRSRGFAFVQYRARGDAEAAMTALGGKVLHGRKMIVRPATAK
jgi:RNA recognition motif-containing protein